VPIILYLHTHRFTLHRIDVLINSHSWSSLVNIRRSYKSVEQQVTQLVLLLSWHHVISQQDILIRWIPYMYIHTHHINLFAHSHPCSISIFITSLYKRGRTTNLVINTSVHIELISLITCEYIVLFKMCELRNGFPYAPCWYDVPVIAQDNFKHYRQFKETW
jgi:hypothetical protein